MIELPNKSHFKADEVCGFTGVKPYVLRFWETEFEQISPVVSSSGQKLYEQSDVEAILAIKKLLFDDKLTVEQARLELIQRHSSNVEASDESATPSVSTQTQMRGFDDQEIKKLMNAKEKLADLVSLTQSVQQRHNWL